MMQIGALAAKAGITPRAVRYYEELGMIQPVERTEGGFRLYSEGQLQRLFIIRNLKSMGFDLERIQTLFSLRSRAQSGGELAGSMVEFLERQQEEINQKLTQYRQMKEGNSQAIELLKDCLFCPLEIAARDCHGCRIYQQHANIPDVVECAHYSP